VAQFTRRVFFAERKGGRGFKGRKKRKRGGKKEEERGGAMTSSFVLSLSKGLKGGRMQGKGGGR